MYQASIRAFFVCVLVAISQLVVADEPTPHQIVDEVSRKLLQVAADKSGLLASEPEAYYAAVGELLDPVVDFDFIARAVMGSYYGSATAEQRQTFARVFRQGMIATYSKGIAGFGGLDMQVVPPAEDVAQQRRVSVLQEVRNGEKINRVYYTMAKNRQGAWKLINMVLNGVNLGETLRNQFSSSMQRTGSIDKVIAQWSADVSAVADKQG